MLNKKEIQKLAEEKIIHEEGNFSALYSAGILKEIRGFIIGYTTCQQTEVEPLQILLDAAKEALTNKAELQHELDRVKKLLKRKVEQYLIAKEPFYSPAHINILWMEYAKQNNL